MLAFFVIINIMAFTVCAFDKLCAVKQKWRVKENTLLLLALLGGATGLFLSMQICRHKIRIVKFKLLIPLFILLQAILIYVIYI